MKRGKCRLRCILLALCMLAVTAGCASGANEQSKTDSVYENEEKLINPYSSYQMGDCRQEISGRTITGTYDDFEGMVLLWTFEADRDMALDVTYRISVTGGRAKLVLIDPEDKISVLTEAAGQSEMYESTVDTLSIRDGLNRMKLVGTEDTVVTFEVTIEKGDFVGI